MKIRSVISICIILFVVSNIRGSFLELELNGLVSTNLFTPAMDAAADAYNPFAPANNTMSQFAIGDPLTLFLRIEVPSYIRIPGPDFNIFGDGDANGEFRGSFFDPGGILRGDGAVSWWLNQAGPILDFSDISGPGLWDFGFTLNTSSGLGQFTLYPQHVYEFQGRLIADIVSYKSSGLAPDTGSTVLLLGLGLFGLAAIRPKLS
jgi:hypothetical protein